MFKLLVCGSREIRDKDIVFKTLDFLLSNKDLNEVILIHGNQKSFDKHLEVFYGADYFAKLWAVTRKIQQIPFPADWNKFGKSAGPIRNKQMVNEKPNACVGFLSKSAKNIGTKNMLKLCEDKEILTKKYYI